MKKFEDYKLGSMFRTRKVICVYTENIKKGDVPELMKHDNIRSVLFFKKSILMLIAHPTDINKRILKFYSDDLLGESQKKGTLTQNCHMNCFEVDSDAYVPTLVLSDCKGDFNQFKGAVTIPNNIYNTEELFSNILKLSKTRAGNI
jgi:hypothetical protein